MHGNQYRGGAGGRRADGLPASTLAAFLLNAVAPSVLERSLSSGDVDASALVDAARQLVRGITGSAATGR